MKHNLHLALAILLLQSTHLANAQVTKLSNNTNFQFGLQIPAGNKAIMVSQTDSLWITDGTPAPGGTFKYATNVAVDSNSNIGYFANKIFFTGVNAANGYELWVTDGTAAGTVLFKDIVPGAASSFPMEYIATSTALLFFANTPANGIELWKSDGTSAGTVMVKDINPGVGNSLNFVTDYFLLNNILYFNANNGTNGTELWKTDGTTAGTVLVKDIYAGPNSSDASGFTQLGTAIIFSATDLANGTELWKTDGTTAGTVLVKDIIPGGDPFLGSSSPSQFLLFNDKLYFSIINFASGGTGALWVTNGTTAGTVLVKNDLFPTLFNAVFINNKFYFTAQTSTQGGELWVSDGTTVGTLLFKDIVPGVNGSDPIIMLDFFGAGVGGLAATHTSLYNGKIFFVANNVTNGEELWITDGTVAGTKMVKDINTAGSGLDLSNFNYIYTVQGLFFAANDGSNGNELWRSDGTTGGTTRITDINPGANSSNPMFLLVLNNRILFNANDGVGASGDMDFYRLDQLINPLPISLLDFTALLSGKNVQLKWITTQEINTSHFEIERSIDNVQFENIGSLKAAVNSARQVSYQFDDTKAFYLGVSKIFYRLKIVDKDGRFIYSKLVPVNINQGKQVFTIYPNPVKDQLLILLKDAKPTQIIIIDESGKQVLRQQLSDQSGTQYKINVSMLKSGVYNIQLFTNDGTRTGTMIKY